MPNGGPTPACLHCKWFVMEDRYCTRHLFHIGVSIPRLLCSELVIENEMDWVKQRVNLTSLVPNLLYVWLEVDYIDPNAISHHTFNLFPLGFIRHYALWSEDEEAEMIAELSEAHRHLYPKPGFKLR